MELPQTGGCQCGKIRHTISEAPQQVYACHCRDCQRLTSSAFSMGIVVAEGNFRMSGVSLGRSSASPIAVGRASGGYVRNAGLGLPAPRGMTGSGPGGHTRRYVMAQTHPAYLDAQQAAVGGFRRWR
jgi:hypothetical protein